MIQKNNPNTVSEHVILYDAKNHDILSEDDTATLKECSLDGSVVRWHFYIDNFTFNVD